MQDNFYKKLVTLKTQYDEIQSILNREESTQDMNRFMLLSKESAKLKPIVECFLQYNTLQNTLVGIENFSKEEVEVELQQLASEEKASVQQQLDQLKQQLQILLIPKHPDDDCNVFLEIRAAAGGTEAAIFAGDLFKMYARYAENNHWKIDILNTNVTEKNGYKEIVLKVVGNAAYAKLKYESGTHRVQRVPETEAQGRLHTSTCTVAILPESSEVEKTVLHPDELRTYTFKASGAGGQHVQKTESAVRIVHLPTGLTVECQDERSQHKNRARAMSLLQAKLVAANKAKKHQEEAATRKSLVGSGDRSERIRTYNFPQSRVTDHRIKENYPLDSILHGGLSTIISTLQNEEQIKQLNAIDK